MIGVAFISDRADLYLPDCLDSLAEHVDYPFDHFTVVDDRDHKLGLAGSVRKAWESALDASCDYLFHVEEDFRFTTDVDILDLALVLEDDPTLAQVVLKRQPWSPEEIAAGGIIELHPEDYEDRGSYVVHKRIFSLNPCLIPARIMEIGWPDGNEAAMTEQLVAMGYHFAFYGRWEDRPRVVHVGTVRGQGWRE